MNAQKNQTLHRGRRVIDFPLVLSLVVLAAAVTFVSGVRDTWETHLAFIVSALVSGVVLIRFQKGSIYTNVFTLIILVGIVSYFITTDVHRGYYLFTIPLSVVIFFIYTPSIIIGALIASAYFKKTIKSVVISLLLSASVLFIVYGLAGVGLSGNNVWIHFSPTVSKDRAEEVLNSWGVLESSYIYKNPSDTFVRAQFRASNPHIAWMYVRWFKVHNNPEVEKIKQDGFMLSL